MNIKRPGLPTPIFIPNSNNVQSHHHPQAFLGRKPENSVKKKHFFKDTNTETVMNSYLMLSNEQKVKVNLHFQTDNIVQIVYSKDSSKILELSEVINGILFQNTKQSAESLKSRANRHVFKDHPLFDYEKSEFVPIHINSNVTNQPLEILVYPKKDGYCIHLECFSCNIIGWPSNVIVRHDSLIIFASNSNYNLRFLDVTAFSGQKIQVCYTGQEIDYQIVLRYAKPLSDNEIIESLGKYENKEVLINCFRTGMLHQNPGKFRKCSHNECFDVIKFLKSNIQDVHNLKCPICHVVDNYNELVLNQYLMKEIENITRKSPNQNDFSSPEF